MVAHSHKYSYISLLLLPPVERGAEFDSCRGHSIIFYFLNLFKELDLSSAIYPVIPFQPQIS